MTPYEAELIERARANVRALDDLHPCQYRRGECIVCSAQQMIEALLETFVASSGATQGTGTTAASSSGGGTA